MAQHVGAELFDHRERVEHVAERLRHLVAIGAEQEAVDEDVARDLDLGGHQQRRPVDRVELEDVLADHVEVRRPVALGQVLAGAGVGERGVVVEQRVEPDIEDVPASQGTPTPQVSFLRVSETSVRPPARKLRASL